MHLPYHHQHNQHLRILDGTYVPSQSTFNPNCSFSELFLPRLSHDQPAVYVSVLWVNHKVIRVTDNFPHSLQKNYTQVPPRKYRNGCLNNQSVTWCHFCLIFPQYKRFVTVRKPAVQTVSKQQSPLFNVRYYYII